MKTQLDISLRKTNTRLQHNAFTYYVKMLRKLCVDHQTVDGVPDLLHLIDAQDWNAVLDLADSWSEQKYSDRTLHFVRNQFAALIRKYPWEKRVSANPERTALKKFLKAEHNCHRVNQRFKARDASRRFPYETEIVSMSNFISYVIGHSPDLQKIYESAAFGPGASIGVHGNATNVARKLLSKRWSVTRGAHPYAFAAIMRHAQFREILIPEHGGFTSGDAELSLERETYSERAHVVAYNKITFVPKTAKTLRSIAVEPLLNGFIQKGVDIQMRLFLKRVGIDLSDQSRNQEFARLGSVPGCSDPFVTIDLSSASDSIATEVVRRIVPFDWFYLLDSIRSKSFKLDDSVYPYHKFCSMGNGFCFPLETLIFASACSAVGAGRPGKDFLVYGDDIIVRQSFAEKLILLLNYLGFKVNKDKTFLSGPFRESCGSDWFENEDVRPYTLDHALDSVQNIFKLLNLSRRSWRTELFFSGIRPFVLSLLPPTLRLWRPQKGNADTAIDSTSDEHLTAMHCRFNRSLQCWEYLELISVPSPDSFWAKEKDGHIALLWGALSGSASSAPFTRRRSRRTKVRFTAYSGATSLWLPAA